MLTGKMLAIVLVLLLCNASMSVCSDVTVREKVGKLGVGAKVKVELRVNQREIKGRISEVRDSDFVVVVDSTRQAATIAYSAVKDLNNHHVLGHVGKIAMWTGIASGIALGVGAVVCGTRRCGG